MITSLDHSVSYLLFTAPRLPFCSCFVLFVCFGFGLCFVASDFLTTIRRLAIVNVYVIIILPTGNTQISVLFLCFLYSFVDLTISMKELVN